MKVLWPSPSRTMGQNQLKNPAGAIYLQEDTDAFPKMMVARLRKESLTRRLTCPTDLCVLTFYLHLFIPHNQMNLPKDWLVLGHLTQARAIWEAGTSTEKTPPPQTGF